MKTKNSNLTWEEIEKYLDKDTYKEFLKHISPSVFEEVKDEKNRPKVLKTVLKILRERDPQNATEEYAQKLIDSMQKIAKKILKQKS
jgi:hypothetical protein